MIVGLAPFSQLITGVPAVHPGCWLNVPNTGPLHLATLPVRFGPSTLWQIDLPEFLDPMTLWFQGVHFDAAGTEVFTTDRLGVPIVK